jgi:hypothetical protein
MTNEHGKCAVALVPGDPFTLAYADFIQARTAFVEKCPDATQFEMGDEGYDLMVKGSDALDAMMRIEAPSMFALFLKLQAIGECPWPWSIGDYQARLTADAALLSMQFAKAWLQRWTGHGGHVIIDSLNDNKLAIFKPAYSLSTDAATDAAVTDQIEVPESVRDARRQWLAPFYDGKMRELEEIMDAVPGAIAAVKAIVAENPAAGLGPIANVEEAR